VVVRLTSVGCLKDAGEAELQDMIEKMMVLRRPAILWKSLQTSSDELAQLIVDLRAEGDLDVLSPLSSTNDHGELLAEPEMLLKYSFSGFESYDDTVYS